MLRAMTGQSGLYSMATKLPRWGRSKMSHFDYAVRYDLRAARGFVKPLAHDRPVPGCGCPACTGVPEDSPARQPVRPRDFSGWESRAEKARSYPILEIAKRIGLEVQKKGRSWVASCPLHEDRTPSLSISPHKGRSGLWHCFSCGASGDAIELFMRTHRTGFGDAVRDLVPGEWKED